ncbi:MAG: tetratricopeptide repeat protein [Bacteroidales bacterium]|nr:tetratricopeptide repeat protein [Bacteroidales bacterium]
MNKIAITTLIFWTLCNFQLLHAVNQHDISNKRDSLKRELESADGEKRPDLLLNIGFEYRKIDSIELSFNYLNRALLEAKSTNNLEVLKSANYQLGDLFFHYDNFTKSQEHYFESYNLSVEAKDEELLIYSSAGLAGIYIQTKDWKHAKQYANNALEHAIKGNFRYDIPKIQNLMGIIMLRSGNLDSAVSIFTEVLQSGIELKDSFLIGGAYNNLAHTRTAQGKYELAIELLQKSYDIAYVKTNSKAVATIYSNLGNSYLQLKDYPKAEFYFAKADTIIKQQGYLSIAKSIYERLSILYEETGRSQKALHYYKLYEQTKDSLLNLDKQKQIQSLHFQNLQKQTEQELQILKQQALLRNLILIFSAITILMLLFLFFQSYRSFKLKLKLQESEKNKMESQIEQLNRELTTLAMNLAQKKQLISDVESTLKNIKNTSKEEPVRDFLNNINSKFKADNYLDHNWDSFVKHFNSVHPDFLDGLQKAHKNLNSNDIKHCAYIKLNMGLKEIAIMNNINVKSVHMIRYRLKKKLELKNDEDLTDYINRFNQQTKK